MLTIYGASDDLVELEGIYHDELNPNNDGVILVIGNHQPQPGENAAGCIVRIVYAEKLDCGPVGNGAVWSAQVQQFDEDTLIPWDVRVVAEGYSVRVQVDCPSGTPVEAWVAGEMVWHNGTALDVEE